MKSYKVKWETDAEAIGPVEAARLARAQQYPGTSANFFTVVDEDGEEFEIDLQKFGGDPLPAPEPKVVRLVAEVRGGMLDSVKGDCASEGVEIEVHVVDHDNLWDRDEPPTEEDIEEGERILKEFETTPHTIYL